MTDTFFGRPVILLLLVLGVLCSVNLCFYVFAQQRLAEQEENSSLFDIAVSGLGLSDLCVATEARYTRHPAVSDPVAPFMDHPGAIEHFPTGSFWEPPSFGVPSGEQH